jgi:hypothetical protein
VLHQSKLNNIKHSNCKLNNFDVEQKTKQFQVGDLISALGGSLGLFTGMAIIMIFEVFELFCDLICAFGKHLTSYNNKTRGRKIIAK